MPGKIKEYAIILVIVGFLAYLPSLFGNFVWDDEDFVTANVYVQRMQVGKFFTEDALAGRGKNSDYYRPVQFSLYSLIYGLAGPQPWIFHLAGILLHLMAGIVVYLTLVYFINPFPAFVAGLLFLVHPVQTESVSYISGMSDQIYTVFFFASLLLYLQNEAGKWSTKLALSLLLFVLSMLSKELGIILPGILFLIVLFRGKDIRKQLPALAVFFILAFGYLALRLTVLKFDDIANAWRGSPYAAHFTTRLATFFHNFFTYVSLLVFPKSLFMERDYTVPIITSLSSWWTVFFFVFNTAVVLGLYVVRKRKEFRTALMFYVLFVASLVPFTGVFLLNGIFYEHYLYLPMIFFWASVVSALSPLIRRKYITALLCLVFVLLIGRSYLRQWDWIDNERFYRQTLVRAPKSIRIVNGLGMTLADKNDCQNALAVYRQAIALNPSVPNIYHNMANCYLFLGQINEAEQHYLQAIKTDPSFQFSYISLLNLYLQTGQKEKAKAFIQDTMLKRFTNTPELNNILNSLN